MWIVEVSDAQVEKIERVGNGDLQSILDFQRTAIHDGPQGSARKGPHGPESGITRQSRSGQAS